MNRLEITNKPYELIFLTKPYFNSYVNKTHNIALPIHRHEPIGSLGP